jgi:hypothetical protein
MLGYLRAHRGQRFASTTAVAPMTEGVCSYLKHQLAKRGVAFEALDNGIKSCANPKLPQRLSDELTHRVR